MQRHPTLYPVVFGNARRAVLRRFPYSVIYVVRDNELLVAACIHSRLDGLLCSCNARSQKTFVGHAQWETI